jgi:hypothetical protein
MNDMGYFKDEHLILTCSEKEPLNLMRGVLVELIHQKVEEWEEEIDFSGYVGLVVGTINKLLLRIVEGLLKRFYKQQPVTNSVANLTYSLYIPADGSKEGWTTSQIMDEVREQLQRVIIHHNAKGEDKIQVILVTADDYQENPSAEWWVKR